MMKNEACINILNGCHKKIITWKNITAFILVTEIHYNNHNRMELKMLGEANMIKQEIQDLLT
ncbi:hypothetical protein GCM10026983_09570 [Gracilibacillus alcaliphilus]